MGSGTVNKKRIAAEYDAFWESGLAASDDWTRFGMLPLRMQAVHLVPSSEGRVLDIGCGNGFALAVLRRLGHPAIGCDISLRALHDALPHGDVARADACHLPFRDASFRAILMLDALEHIVEKPDAIRESHRLLADRGTLVVTTPLPKATGGHGDSRQPYDQPATFPDIVAMISGLFRIRAARGSGWEPRGLSRVARWLPKELYPILPFLLQNSEEVLLLLDKV